MRDVISTEMWEALNSFYLMLGRYDLHAALQTGPYSFYQEVKERCGAVLGAARPDDAARRGPRVPGGRRPHRGGGHGAADAAGGDPDPLAATLDRPAHETEAIALLHAVGGFQAYRRAVRAAPSVVPVARFLLFDSAYPGSVASSIDGLARR